MKLINKKLEIFQGNIFVFRLYIFGVRVCKKFIDVEKFCECKYKQLDDFDVDKRKSVLIVKTDSIGDYVMMRNFWKIIKESRKYKNAKITLILSSAMRGIAETLDKDVVDKIFYVPHPFWKESDYKKLKVLKKLFAEGLDTHFDTVMFPNVNVYLFLGFNNMVAASVHAYEYIGQIGDLDWDNINHMSLLSRMTYVVPNYTARSTFEFYNNHDFFSRALGEKLNIKMHNIDIPKSVQDKTVVVAPCAQDNYRMWNINNFAKVIKYLLDDKYNVILIGGKGDKKYLEKLNGLVNNKATVYADMPFGQVINTINNAELFIGMDSGMFHIAVSLKTPAVCISSGMSFARFMHYPESNKYKVVFALETLEHLAKWFKKSGNDRVFCPFIGCIGSVQVSQVMDAVSRVLNQRKKK